MLGYSRTVRRWNDTTPTSGMMRLSTVAKTGRRMQNSNPPSAADPASAWKQRIGRHDVDGDAVAQALLARRHDDVARFDAFDDLDMTGLAHTQVHLGLDRLTVDDPVDEDVGATRHDGAFRHRDDADDLRPLHGDAREQPGPQRPVVVGQAGADLQGAAVHVHHRIDGIDDAGEGAAGERIDRHQDVLADPDVRQEPLRDI